MKITDVFNSATIADNYAEAGSNLIPYLGAGFFPPVKRAGLDLKWIKGYKGLPVSLSPAVFNADPPIRERIGINVNKTNMPFFREAMIVDEEDEQEILRIKDSGDPYAEQVIRHIYSDAETLIAGADVAAERMRMQLLSPVGGNMGIEIKANGVNYTYDYDSGGEWKKNHYLKIAGESDKWSASETCKPLDDIEEALERQTNNGSSPKRMLLSAGTLKLMKKSSQIQKAVLAQSMTANVNMTSKRIISLINEEFDLDVIVYKKKYKNEAGIEKSFYPDGIFILLPEGNIGYTNYGTTPEERTLSSVDGADITLVNTGVAVAVIRKNEVPVKTETVASEIVLPSFEGMDECCAMEVI